MKHPLRAARLTTHVHFALYSTPTGTQVAPPRTEERLDVNHAAPGSLPVLLRLGAIAGTQIPP